MCLAPVYIYRSIHYKRNNKKDFQINETHVRVNIELHSFGDVRLSCKSTRHDLLCDIPTSSIELH